MGEIVAMSTTSKIVVRASADFYLGDPQFQLMIDGKPFGAVQGVTASHTKNVWQDLTFIGDFGTTGPSKIDIVYINDLYGGSRDKDRNLYLDKITVNGKIFETELVGVYDRVSGSDLTGTQNMYWAGAMRFDTAGAAPTTISSSSTTTTTTTSTSADDTIVVRASGDYYLGSPQFMLLIDGKQVGTTQTVSALHSNGAWQDFTFKTDLTTGTHKVEVVYTNDVWGGSGSLDRNLYIDKIAVNGTVYQSEEDAVFLSRSGTLSAGREKMASAGELIFEITTVATSTEPTPTSTTGSPSPSPTATGEFVVGDDGKMYDPQGHVFEVHGGNLFPSSCSDAMVEAIGPDGWNLNALRLNWAPGQYTYEQLDNAIAAYTSIGIVTIVEWHRVGGYGDSLTERKAILDFFSRLAEKYQDNPYVWYGGYNEPGGSGDVVQVNGQWQWDSTDVNRWVDLSRDIIETVRDAGAKAPVLVPSMALAQDILMTSNWNRDVGFSKPIEEASAILKFGDRITSGFENVAFDVHLYGNYNTKDRLKNLDLFLDKAEERGTAIVFGEYGSGVYNNTKTTDTIQSSKNMAALRDEHSFGDIVWHAQAKDPNDVTIAPGTNGGVLDVNSFTNPTNLTELGHIVWEGTH
jgi:hypothetical protein